MEQLLSRVNNIINTCWESFSAKVGGGLIIVNKEASMQLHFAYLLKNTIDLAIHHSDESITIELETGIEVNGRLREADLVVHLIKAEVEIFLPIEMKCYKNRTSTNKLRGAQDLFRHSVYEDLVLLESYAQNSNYIQGIQLTMTDSRLFGFPENTNTKSWAFNTSNGFVIENGTILDVPMGDTKGIVNITLTKNYMFNWTEIYGYCFLMLRGS